MCPYVNRPGVLQFPVYLVADESPVAVPPDVTERRALHLADQLDGLTEQAGPSLGAEADHQSGPGSNINKLPASQPRAGLVQACKDFV